LLHQPSPTLQGQGLKGTKDKGTGAGADPSRHLGRNQGTLLHVPGAGDKGQSHAWSRKEGFPIQAGTKVVTGKVGQAGVSRCS